MTPAEIETLVRSIFTKLRDHAAALGVFEHVKGHALTNPPQSGLAVSFEFGSMRPYAAGSGLNVTSAVLTANASVYQHMQTQPLDDIEPRIAGAAAALIVAFSGDFDLGSNVRNVDLLGATGQGLGAEGGYVQLASDTTFRVANVTIPMVINNVFEQVN